MSKLILNLKQKKEESSSHTKSKPNRQHINFGNTYAMNEPYLCDIFLAVSRILWVNFVFCFFILLPSVVVIVGECTKKKKTDQKYQNVTKNKTNEISPFFREILIGNRCKMILFLNTVWWKIWFVCCTVWKCEKISFIVSTIQAKGLHSKFDFVIRLNCWC